MKTEHKAIALCLASALALATTTEARADDVVPGATSEPVTVAPTTRRPNRTLFWTGLITFSVTYTGSVVAGGAAGDRVEDKNLFIPLVGPWLDLGQRNCEFRRCDDGQEAIWKSLIIASGVVQGASALLTLSSFFIPETTWSKQQASTPPKPELHVAPIGYAGGGGLGAVGRF